AARGEYATQLERWFAVYPREQILVLRSENLYQRRAAPRARALEFLGLPVVTLEDYPRYTRRTAAGEMPSGTRRRLREDFRPRNDRLAALVGPDIRWDD